MTPGFSAISTSVKYGFLPLTIRLPWCKSRTPAKYIIAVRRPVWR